MSLLIPHYPHLGTPVGLGLLQCKTSVMTPLPTALTAFQLLVHDVHLNALHLQVCKCANLNLYMADSADLDLLMRRHGDSSLASAGIRLKGPDGDRS